MFLKIISKCAKHYRRQAGLKWIHTSSCSPTSVSSRHSRKTCRWKPVFRLSGSTPLEFRNSAVLNFLPYPPECTSLACECARCEPASSEELASLIKANYSFTVTPLLEFLSCCRICNYVQIAKPVGIVVEWAFVAKDAHAFTTQFPRN